MSALDPVYRLRAGLELVQPDAERAFLLGEREALGVGSPLLRALLAAVDGQTTASGIGRRLAGRFAAPEVLHALGRLRRDGVLSEVDPAISAEADFFTALTPAPGNAGALRPRVRALEPEQRAPLEQALERAGVELAAEDAALTLLACDDYLDPRLEAAVQELAGNVLLAKLAGELIWLGPRLGALPAACLCCLQQRLRENRPVERYLGAQYPALGAPRCTPARAGASLQLAGAWVAFALARAAHGGDSWNACLETWDLRTYAYQRHAVGRRPQCPRCGDPGFMARQIRAPVELQSRPKRFTADGGHRIAPPEETLQRYQHLVSPITGVVTSLGPVPGRDHPLRPVYGAAYRLTPRTRQLVAEEWFGRPSCGKGRSAVQARASALCEALERWAGVYQGDEPVLRARMRELDPAGVDPRALLDFSARQYAERERENLTVRDYREAVPLPFDPEMSIDWTPAWSLTHGRRCYLPTAYCFSYYPAPPGEQVCLHNPNGHAAGRCREEAILQGLLELVERDAAALWWYNRLLRPAIALESADDGFATTLVGHYREQGWRLWALDLTSDLGIPAVVALAEEQEGGRYAVGFGCHLEARIAVQRALTEVNQVFDPSGVQPAPWTLADIVDPAFLRPDPASTPRQVHALGSCAASDDLAQDVRACVQLLAERQLETIVLDYTRPDVELSTVKVTVPGLRHFWRRLGPGRLYDVPVAMGWLPRALREEELNPRALLL